MNFSYQDLISVEEILADALPVVDDREMRQFTPGWYRRQVREGLNRVNYIAPFTESFKDYPMPENLVFDLPSGVWDIKDLFLWNGKECKIENSHRVFHKAGFHTKGSGLGYTANRKTGQSDYFVPFTAVNDNVVHFYNVSSGRIMFSDSCKGYDNFRIVFNGLPKDIDEVKFIPPFCREFLVGYVVERFYFSIKRIDPQARIHWGDAKADIYSPLGVTEPSKYDRCIELIKTIDKKQLSDLGEYLSKMNY